MHQFLQALQKDHEEVKDILSQLEGTSEGAVKSKEKLFLKLKQELIPHMKVEEKHFYPGIGENKELRQIALEAIEEHHVAETILKELDSLGKDKENWSAKMAVFKEILEHHIEEEEDEIFDVAGEALDNDQLNRMMESFQSDKDKIKQKIK